MTYSFLSNRSVSLIALVVKGIERVIDIFAGAGGASIGLDAYLLEHGRQVDVAINHDPVALAMHQVNHPNTKHILTNIYAVDPRDVLPGEPIGLLWASPDCTHHSRAKGGKPRESHKRELANSLHEWIRHRRPRCIIVENVLEFTEWGPLDATGKPIRECKGEYFMAWVRRIRSAGYRVEWRRLRGCDFGAATYRERVFIVCRCDDQPITWPEPTHKPSEFRVTADCIDWTKQGKSIFGRKKMHAPKTLERLRRGVWRYVIENPKPFIVPVGVNRGEMALVAASVQKFSENSTGQPLTDPIHTVMAGATRFALVSAFLTPNYGEREGQLPRFQSIGDPYPTICGSSNSTLVMSTLVKFKNNSYGESIQEPLTTICASTIHHGEVRVITAPANCPDIDWDNAHRVYAFLMAYYGTDQDSRIERPIATITSRDRLALVFVHADQEYVITDITLRMLTPRELFRCQGFPDTYVIDITPPSQVITAKRRSKTNLTLAEQVECVGNSVCPPVAEHLARANFYPGRGTVRPLRKPSRAAKPGDQKQLRLAI